MINLKIIPVLLLTYRITSYAKCIREGGICEKDNDCCGYDDTPAVVCNRKFRHIPRNRCEKEEVKPKRAFSYSKRRKTYNNLGQTPPMGWNPWSCFGDVGEGVTEEIVLQAAKVMKEKLHSAGYEYINLDCGWSSRHRHPVTGDFVVNEERFPHGLKWLGDQIHDLGLKFGIYGALGYHQCCSGTADHMANDGSGPGCGPGNRNCRSEGYFKQDAQLWASWGVDLLKFDGCGGPFESVAAMGQALLETNREIVYSVHSNIDEDGNMTSNLANFWRTGRDIWPSYEQVLGRAMQNDKVNKYLPGGPGGWNDPDMMQVGSFGNKDNGNHPSTIDPVAESRTHFALWCLMKSPLIIGTFLHNITDTYVDILTNPLALSVNKDPLGEQGVLRKDGGWKMHKENRSAGFQIWSGALSGRGAAAVLANLEGYSKQKLTLTNKEMPVSRTMIEKWDIVEAFSGEKRLSVTLPQTVEIPPHDVAFWILTPTPSIL